ncbi:C1 family peptidase [Roseibium aggregatum]|uniref:Peptidase C1 n=1 Tax=Roseibium aggregatum TaxID=187304 RepID=A0A926NWC1_9HYPH|nr:C1 family peptidase [Roseibium aggregatum]MBD1544865.1 peptidase C1 [Roseibium aggregatum]
MRKACLAALLLFTLMPFNGAQAQYVTGARLDPDVYVKIPKTPPLARGGYASLPPSVSLKKFAPTPGDQGRQGSCVGWASAYAARTLSEAERLQMGDRAAINQSRFSPAFVYNQIRLGGCGDGSYPSDALDLIKNVGVPLLKDFPYTDESCNREPERNELSLASGYRIKGYQRLFNDDSTAKHIAVRRSLANGHPVVIGMQVSENFMRSSEVYRGSNEDLMALQTGDLGGHAMAVIGYDDTKYGGAFEFINSWGTDWGNGGFIWVTYDAFNTYVMQGYEMIPPDPPRPPAVVDMGGEIRFRHISGRPMPGSIVSAGMSFRLDDPWPSGTRFRVEIGASDGAYVYALGGDLSGKFVELFPRGGGVSPHVDGGSTLLMPGPNEQFFTRMNDDTGTDFYVVLFAREPLPVKDIVARMSDASGNVRDKLEAALGDLAVDSANVKLTGNGMGFEAASDGRTVVPMVVSIEHVDRAPADRDRDPPKLVVSEPAVDELEQVVTDDPVRRVSSPTFLLRGNAQDEGRIQSVEVAEAGATRFSSRGPFQAEIEIPDDNQPHEVRISAVDADGNRAETTIRVIVKP